MRFNCGCLASIPRRRRAVGVALADHAAGGDAAVQFAWKVRIIARAKGPAVAFEHVTAIKRAGADIILTYFARAFAEAFTER